MKRFTLILSLMVAMVTTAMAQKAHQRVSHDGWVVTALNEAGRSNNEGGVAFIADDNASTFYHSNWSSSYTDGNGVHKGKDGLQAFMVELPTSLSDLSLITYKGRSDGNGSGWARGVRVYVFETLPTGWPAGGLSSLGYADKEALLASTNEKLGTAAFDNTNSAWDNDQTQKVGVFTTPKTGKYVLFIMESGSDNWLTCSDFQIYQLKDYAAIKEDNPYYLQVTNAAASGNRFIDTKTAIGDNQGLSTVAISEESVETYFAWTGTAWNIKDADGKYVGVTKWCAPPLQDTGTDWHLLVNEDNTLTFFQNTSYGGERKERCFLGGDVISDESVVKLYTDNYIYKAINVKLIDASAVPVTVKYVFTWNGVEKDIQTVETFSGELYPDVNYELPFGVAATKPDGEIDAKEAVEGVITKTIALENTLPFAYADSYANINNWYYLQFHANQKNYLYYDGTANVLDASKTAVDATQRDNYTWGFIGDPFTGFTVVNRGAGESKALNAGENGAIVGAETQKLTLTASSHGENGFFMQNLSGDYTQRFNKQNNKVVYWSGADAGSTFMVVERDMTGAAELQELVDGVDAVSASYQGAIGTAVGNLTEESVTTVANALATAKSILALDDRTPEQISEAHVALQAAIDGLVTVQPEEGKFYTIASASEQDNDSRTGKMIYVNTDGGMKFYTTTSTDLGCLFQFEDAGDGQFYMYNVARDRYLNTANAHAHGQEKALAEETTSAKKVKIANLGRENVVGLWPEGGAMIHAEASTEKVVAWNNEQNNNGSAWRIVEVENPTITSVDLTIGEAGYATLYLGCAVTVPAGVKAFPVTVDGNWAVFGEALTTIPANTGVVIAGENGKAATADTYKFNYAAPVNAIEGNKLAGSTIDTYVEGSAYVLGYINVADEGEEERKEVGFYTAALNLGAGGTTGTTHFKNNANKAYLPKTEGMSAASYSFRFEGEGTTGIEQITDNREQSTVIYDLTGRRIEAITAPGVYIVNGKKVLVK